MAHIVDFIKESTMQSEKTTNYKILLKETFEIINSAVKASGSLLYILEDRKKCLVSEDLYFKFGSIEKWESSPGSEVMACLPLHSSDDMYIGEMCIFREEKNGPFTKDEQKVVNSALKWVGKSLIRNSLEDELLIRHTEGIIQIHTRFLKKCHLAVSSRDSKEVAVVDIMDDIKEIVRASKVKVFLFNPEGEFIWPPEYCDMYDMVDHSSRWLKERSRQKVEFSKECDLAWHTVKENVLINLMDSMSDPRFGRKIDIKYGYHVRNMISFPIHIKDKVTGAVNVINKTDAPYFTSTDEFFCYVIGEYFSYIIDYIDIQENFEKSRLKWENAKDMLSYHLQPKAWCIEELLSSKIAEKLPEEFLSFDWYPFDLEDQLVHLAFFMVQSMSDKTLDADRIAKFILSSKKSYFPGCFYNFEHAVSVLHCVYNIYQRNMEEFSSLEATALAIAATAHDFDPSMSMDLDPMAPLLHEDSPMRYHKCQMLDALIQDTKIFAHYDKGSYSKILDLIMNMVASTDISIGFENMIGIQELMNIDGFDRKIPLNRCRFLRLIMSGAELSGEVKPFHITRVITEKLYEDFYRQGDVWKRLGSCPVERMDREALSTIPEQQTMFLNIICKPIYRLLSTFLPNTKQLLERCSEAISSWEAERGAYRKQDEIGPQEVKRRSINPLPGLNKIFG